MPVPTWQSQPVGRSRRFPRGGQTGSAGLGGLIVDFVAGTGEDILGRLAASRAPMVRAQGARQGRSAGLRAALEGGGAPPEAENTFSIGAGAFNEGAVTGWLAGMDNRIRQKLAERASAHPADPEGFREDAAGVLGELGELPEDLAPDIEIEIEARTSEIAIGLERERRDRQRELSTAELRLSVADIGREAAAAARAGDGDRAAGLLQRRNALIQAGVKEGLYSGEAASAELLRGESEVAEQSIWGLYEGARRDGGLPGALAFQNTFRRAAAGQGMTPDQIDRMDQRMARDISQGQAERSRMLAEAERGDRQRSESVFKAGLDAHRSGALNDEWLRRNGPALSGSHYSQLVNLATSERDAPKSDPIVYSNLLARADAGEDIRHDLDRAYAMDRTLRREDADRLRARQDEKQDESVKSGREYIKNLVLGSEFQPDAGRAERFGFARAEYDDYIEEQRAAGRRPTRAELMKQAEYIARSWATFGAEVGRLSERVPAYMVGTRDKIDTHATAIATAEALASGKITPAMAAEQTKMIKEIEFDQRFRSVILNAR